MTENLPILTGKTLSLISLFGLYMRLLDCISIVNSKQGNRPFKLEQPKLLHSDGLELSVPVFFDSSGFVEPIRFQIKTLVVTKPIYYFFR